jgi:AraC-like DNA-binding protein
MSSIPFDGRHFGRERCPPGRFARHRHPFGYICVVLSGRFDEAGDCGRFGLAPGDAVVHQPFEAHLDIFTSAGAEVLNLPLPEPVRSEGRIRLSDPDAVARVAERDLLGAAQEALSGGPCPGDRGDWPDLLAAALGSADPFLLRDWSARHDLAPATVSRGFASAYGVTPARYRAELRARRAWQAIRASSAPLAAVACDGGFADQAHMTRAVRAVTGRPPTRWRAA